MGTTQTKQEEIIVQAAGTGTNAATESTSSSSLTRTEWFLIIVSIILLTILLIWTKKRISKSMRSIIREEINKNEIRKSCDQLAKAPKLKNTPSTSGRIERKAKTIASRVVPELMKTGIGSKLPNPQIHFTPAISEQTLVFVFNTKNKVALGRQNHPFGYGKLNGYGGRVKNGTTIEENAIQKLETESGLKVKSENLINMGHVTYRTASNTRRIHIFKTNIFEGDLISKTTRMWDNDWYPQSILTGDIFGNFMYDGKYWMTYVLENNPFKFEFHIEERILASSSYDIPIKPTDKIPTNIRLPNLL